MDTVFLLNAEARRQFLQRAARVLGCKYICLWSPLDHPSFNHLCSTGGWYQEEENSRPTSGSLPLTLFGSYRKTLCRVETGRVPGVAYQAGVAYFELGSSDLMNFASAQVQKQFYQEAGIKMAAFLGCASGEIELGTTKSHNVNMQANVQQVFREDFIQQFQLRDNSSQLPHVADIISPLALSPSPLRSLSDQSPESSTLLNEMSMQAYSGRYPSGQFPSSAIDDDVVLANAMLAVISSASPTSSKLPQQKQREEIVPHQRGASGVAFKPYNSALAPNSVTTKTGRHGQNMIKAGIEVLRRIRTNPAPPESLMLEPLHTSNQLHHVISERKRREKLNESFHALRMLLPPCSKKDKASVLSNTRNYLNSLRDQITELEERNRALEMQLQAAEVPEARADPSSSTEGMQIHVSRSVDAESTSSGAQIINLRLTIRRECDMIELMISLLERLKGMRDTSLVSVDASTRAPQTSATSVSFRLQQQGSDWDEQSFMDAVTGAVESVVEPPLPVTAAAKVTSRAEGFADQL